MIRKWTTVILSLMLAVMLPLCALADTQHTLKIIPGDELSSEPAIADLLNVLAFTVTAGNNAGALTLALDNQNIATIGFTADATGLYAHSDLLSDEVLYVTWDDGFAFLTDLLMMALEQEGAAAADLEAVETSMTELKTSVVTAMANPAAASASVTTMTQKEEWEMVVELFGDDPQMVEYLQSMRDKMVVENGSFTDANRDTADQKYSMTLDSEDLLKVCDTSYMRTLLTEAMAMEEGVTAEEISANVDAVLEEVREIYRNSNFLTEITMYTLDEGLTLVGMDLTMHMDATAEGETSSMEMALNYNRLTGSDGVNYKGEMTMGAEGEKLMDILFTLERGNNDVSKGMLGFLAEGEEIVITYHAENTAPDTREREAALYHRSGASAILEPAGANRPLIGFELITAPADDAMLSKLESADSTNSVNVMKLSAEEMQALASEVTGRAMQALYTALGKLPTSTLGLFMGEMQ